MKVDIIVNGTVVAKSTESLPAILTASVLSRNGWTWKDRRDIGFIIIESPKTRPSIVFLMDNL